MEQIPGNIFSSLFAFAPREKWSPEENFLTEALVYTLKSSKAAEEAWVSLITNGRVEPGRGIINIETRKSCINSEKKTNIYPDVSVTGDDKTGKPFRILVEHKWGSPYNENQLAAYAKDRKRNENFHLAFVCSKKEDYQKSKSFRSTTNFRAIQWEQIYSELKKLKKPSKMLIEFLSFMETEGLNPGKPFTRDELLKGSNLKNKMMRYCEKLSNEYDWKKIIPKQYSDAYVANNWGRCALIFLHEQSIGLEIALGFYHTTNDHKISFSDPQKGIDLFLRVYAPPGKTGQSDGVLKQFERKIRSIERKSTKVLLKGQPGNGNPYTLIFAQKSLIDVVNGKKEEEQQIDAIYEQLTEWAKKLFFDFNILSPLEETIRFKT